MLLVSLATAVPGGSAQEKSELGINSKRYIVIDADTGEVYAQRNADQRVAIASLTKVYTAVQAIEEAPGDLVLETSEDDLVSADHSQMGFEPGERLTLEELLYGLMLPSGNDAALAIARNLGYQPGDTAEVAVQRFVDRTNQRIRDAGLMNTHLVNPHGWGVPGHYSTARDLATWMMYALRYPRFVDLMSAAEYETEAGFTLTNNNRLLGQYGDLLGGKTGYDWDAGWCLIEVARRDGNTMISVTLDGIHENMDWYDDNEVLLEHGLEEKSARLEAGVPPKGQLLFYRDPDAAVIARSAVAGGALGLTTDPAAVSSGAPPAAVGAAGVVSAPAAAARPAAQAGGIGDDGAQRFWGADLRGVGVALVAVLVLGARAFSVAAGRTRPVRVARRRGAGLS